MASPHQHQDIHIQSPTPQNPLLRPTPKQPVYTPDLPQVNSCPGIKSSNFSDGVARYNKSGNRELQSFGNKAIPNTPSTPLDSRNVARSGLGDLLSSSELPGSSGHRLSSVTRRFQSPSQSLNFPQHHQQGQTSSLLHSGPGETPIQERPNPFVLSSSISTERNDSSDYVLTQNNSIGNESCTSDINRSSTSSATLRRSDVSGRDLLETTSSADDNAGSRKRMRYASAQNEDGDAMDDMAQVRKHLLFPAPPKQNWRI